jgi:hypothetical protein
VTTPSTLTVSRNGDANGGCGSGVSVHVTEKIWIGRGEKMAVQFLSASIRISAKPAPLQSPLHPLKKKAAGLAIALSSMNVPAG